MKSNLDDLEPHLPYLFTKLIEIELQFFNAKLKFKYFADSTKYQHVFCGFPLDKKQTKNEPKSSLPKI